VLLGLSAIGACTAAFLFALAYPRLPDLAALTDYRPSLPLQVYTLDGVLIGEFGTEHRSLVSIREVPDQLRNAIVAAEDERFYQHVGVDYQGIVRAAYANFVSGSSKQGASTITMQVARNFFLSSEKTLTRKFYEALLALKIERNLDKDQILELYVNQIYLGRRSYGFAAAAKAYFDKPLDALTLGECAMLAGLPKAPSTYSPSANAQTARQRQQYVLRRMKSLGFISERQYADALSLPLTLVDSAQRYPIHADYIAETVRQAIYDRYPDEVYRYGFRVYTTVRAADQEASYRALRDGVLEYDRLHGYRGPEARVPLPEQPSEEDYKEALADHPDYDDLVAALVLGASDRQVQAVLRDGQIVTLSGRGLQFAARALQDKAHSLSAQITAPQRFATPLCSESPTAFTPRVARSSSGFPRVSGAE
jgi:penicillin-binding protein 1A